VAHFCLRDPFGQVIAVDLDLRSLWSRPAALFKGFSGQQCLSSYKSYKGACLFSGLMRTVACQLSPGADIGPRSPSAALCQYRP
jgi:hypothetical protein